MTKCRRTFKRRRILEGSKEPVTIQPGLEGKGRSKRILGYEIGAIWSVRKGIHQRAEGCPVWPKEGKL